MYLNLSSDLTNKNQDDGGYERFKFLTEEEANGEQNKWFKVKNILKFEDEFDVIKFALHKYNDDSCRTDFASRAGVFHIAFFVLLSLDLSVEFDCHLYL